MRIWAIAVLAACHGTSATPDSPPGEAAIDAPAIVTPLEVHALGVQGFAIVHDHQLVMTAPLFTRQSAFEVGINLPITPDTAAIDAGLAGLPLGELRAVISGHAHYDHFLDVPHVLALAPQAIAYTNLTGRHILAALAPDRPGCTSAPGTPTIDRARVVALDDDLASHTDYRNCMAQKPANAPAVGTWLEVPNSHLRIMAVCSMHPAQIGPYHFGAGAIDSDQCDLPKPAAGWLEGQTLALLVDFLDAQGKPELRMFYQDAPTNAPIGQVPDDILADKRVDLAILCVGSNDAVMNEPTAIIGNIKPRFVFSGHWEDFFQPLGTTLQPIPLLDLNTYKMRAEAALAEPADGQLLVDGVPVAGRHVLIQPGTTLIVPPPP